MRRLKSLVIALVVLALSTGVAFAARGGLERAATASGKTVPMGPPVEEVAPETEEAEETEDAEEPAAEEEEADETDAEGTHGATVAEAAQGETPDGWANHGAYVSAVARGLAEPGDEAPPEAVENGGRMPKPTSDDTSATGRGHGAERSAAAKPKK